ncbi:MAG: pseudaminic acid synthase [Syntrophales bacterium]
MIESLQINGKLIGPGSPVYIIAEMSANHNQDFSRAVQIMKAAKAAGADAVKLQTYTPDTLTINCDNDLFRIKDTLWNGKLLYELYAEASTPWEWYPKLKEIARELEMDIFSTAFDLTALRFLEEMEVPVHKISSFEIVDIPLIEEVASTGKPLIISTGMATQEEIGDAVRTARASGARQIALLKCTSAYPAPPEEMHLRTIPDMAETFQAPVGLSDHTSGISVPSAAVALGACIIEKHFTLSREIPGPDSAFSLEPHEFRKMVDEVRTVEKALGSVRYGAKEQEQKSKVFRRSLFVIRNMEEGESFDRDNIRSIRPGFGLPPKHYKDILGKKAATFIPRGTPLEWKHIKQDDAD